MCNPEFYIVFSYNVQIYIDLNPLRCIQEKESFRVSEELYDKEGL